MRDISTTPRTLDFSTAPCTIFAVVASACGVVAGGALKVPLPSFCSCCGIGESDEAQFAALRIRLVELPSRTLMVPSGLIEIWRSFGWNVIGPPSPSTDRLRAVTSWPVALICSAPLRV